MTLGLWKFGRSGHHGGGGLARDCTTCALHNDKIGFGNGVPDGLCGLIFSAVVAGAGGRQVWKLHHHVALTAYALLALDRPTAHEKVCAVLFERRACCCEI